MNVKDYQQMLKDKVKERAQKIYDQSPDKPLMSEALVEALIEMLPSSVLKKVKD